MSGLPAGSSSASSSSSTQEFNVRIPKNVKKRYNVMRFHASLNVDVSKWSQARLERENNLKDFKAAEEMPKYGAGSEYGREQREESRRKKYGIIMKKYNPEDQPWLLKTGGKAGKKYRGIREGGIAENAAYYIFVKAPDGAFEAFQVDEWYNFTPVQRYKTLNAEEAEEEFGRRDKVMNFFKIMNRKRNEEEGDKDEEGEKQKKKKNNSKYGVGGADLKISDMDEWLHSSEGDSDEEGTAEATGAADAKNNKKKKPQAKKKKKKNDSDEEGFEDSDDGDDEGREVDYISDESSSSEEEKTDKSNKELQGVEDEEAIRKMEDSESEEENADEKKENAEENKDEATPNKAAKDKKDQKKTASSSESSDTSDSDDFDNDTSFQSPLFVPKSKRNKDSSNSRSSRPNTPTRSFDGKKDSKSERAQKRKAAAINNEDNSNPPAKKSKTQAAMHALQSGASTSSSSTPSSRIQCDLSSDGITEDCVRRYLMRKPMTTTELLHKFKSKKSNFSREQLVNTLAQILKRLDPEKQHVKGKMYLSIKQS